MNPVNHKGLLSGLKKRKESEGELSSVLSPVSYKGLYQD